jgi:hypothetical protein
MYATITAQDTVHIPQIPPSPMGLGGPVMNIASGLRDHTQITLPQIPSSPVATPASASTIGPAASNTDHEVHQRPGLPPSSASTPAILQQPPKPKVHHHSHSSHSHHHHALGRGREDEAKTPAEYALHILFTQVGRNDQLFENTSVDGIRTVCSSRRAQGEQLFTTKPPFRQRTRH